MKKTKLTPTTSPPEMTTKARSWLIFAAVGVFAAIIFGLLYLFVIAPSIPDGSVGWFLFSFATGLTMIVLPCTLPLAFVIVPLSMGKGFVRGIGMALAFGLGIAITLSMYGVVAALLGNVAIDALGADLDAVKNWVYFIAGSFALLFALSEIGLMNVHMPTYQGSAPAFIQKRSELLKALMLGLFLGNVGVGCPHPATPLILIEIASSGDVLYGWLLFLMNAIGRILPLLLLAFLAILGVNGLNWLLARKDVVERATGWSMVFVAGFILTLGLFSHDWWVNSGIHSGLESITQEKTFNVLINNTLGTEVEHAHGLEEGQGLFGLPLEWGNWFLVSVWLIPMWWWYRKRKKEVEGGEDVCDEKVLSVKRNFLILVGILLIMIFVFLLPKNFALKSGGGDNHADDEGHDETSSEVVDPFAEYQKYFDSESDLIFMLIDEDTAREKESSDTTEILNESIDDTPIVQIDESRVLVDGVPEVTGTDIGESQWTFEEGEVVKISFVNNVAIENVDRQLHFHGQKVLLLSIDEVQNTQLEWTDLLTIPSNSDTEVLLRLEKEGQWVIHGHSSENQTFQTIIPFEVKPSIITEDEIQQVAKSIPKNTFIYLDSFELQDYAVEGVGSSPVAERREELKFFIKDRNGNPVSLSSEVAQSLLVTIVDSTDTYVMETFPGNKDFDETGDLDDSEEEHSGFINVAYADVGHAEPEVSETINGLYEVPVIFPVEGSYKVFVQFIPEGDTEQFISSYTIEVREKTFTIDNFGWSDTKKWWILFIGSIFGIIPLVWFVRRYINVT